MKKHGGKKAMGKKAAKKKGANPKQHAKSSTSSLGDTGVAKGSDRGTVTNKADVELAKLMQGRKI